MDSTGDKGHVCMEIIHGKNKVVRYKNEVGWMENTEKIP